MEKRIIEILIKHQNTCRKLVFTNLKFRTL